MFLSLRGWGLGMRLDIRLGGRGSKRGGRVEKEERENRGRGGKVEAKKGKGEEGRKRGEGERGKGRG